MKRHAASKVIRVIGRLAVVEIDDALDRVLLAVRLDQHRIRREVDAVGRQHHVIGHFARGLQILVQQRGRHGQRFAGVVEARRIGRIHRKLPRELHVLAGEIANRVVVLGVAQPARQHQPGIARGLLYLLPRARPESSRSPAALASAGGGGIGLGGISFAVSLSITSAQRGKSAVTMSTAGVRLQIELRGGRRAAVASDAILGDERAYSLVKLPVQGGRGGSGRGHGADNQRYEKKESHCSDTKTSLFTR